MRVKATLENFGRQEEGEKKKRKVGKEIFTKNLCSPCVKHSYMISLNP